MSRAVSRISWTRLPSIWLAALFISFSTQFWSIARSASLGDWTGSTQTFGFLLMHCPSFSMLTWFWIFLPVLDILYLGSASPDRLVSPIAICTVMLIIQTLVPCSSRLKVVNRSSPSDAVSIIRLITSISGISSYYCLWFYSVSLYFYFWSPISSVGTVGCYLYL